MRHENILIATRGYDMVCVLKIHMHPISPNWDLRILTLSGIDRLTLFFFWLRLHGHMAFFKCC